MEMNRGSSEKTTEQKIGEKRLLRNEWFDQECRDEKNKAREKMIQRETRGNCEIYKQLRLRANRICKRKKKERLKGNRRNRDIKLKRSIQLWIG